MKRLDDVAILRVLAVVTLVAWHSYCSYICWNIAESPLNKVYTWLFAIFVPDASMPLFTFLAGYLFCYLFGYKGKYSEFKPFLRNKVKRLLIPYLVLGFVINMTQIGRQNPFELVLGTPNHLWYCLMLFYCFIGCWLLEKRDKRYNVVAMCLSFLLVTVAGGRTIIRSPLGIYMPCYYYGYFYAGFLAFQYKDKVLAAVKKYFVLLLFVYIAMCVVRVYTMHLSLLVQSLIFIAIILYLVNIQYNKISRKYPLEIINKIGKNSFGIYVFHQWIIWNVTRYPGVSAYMSEYYVLFPLCMFVLVFLMSYFLTEICLKTTIGRYLLL